jgi:mRNA interferase MazF
MYKKGDVVIIKFPFADAAEYKKRPALIISNKEVNDTKDYLMVQITSKDKKDSLSFPLNPDDFLKKLELPLKSFVRIHKIFLLNKSLIISKATAITPDCIKNISEKIIKLIKEE